MAPGGFIPGTGILWGTDDVPTVEEWNQSVKPLVNPDCPDETPVIYEMPDGTTRQGACMTNGVVYVPPFPPGFLEDFNFPDLWHVITGG